MAWETILFDLDGTLTDSGPGILNGMEYAVREMGLPPHERDFYRRFIGPPLQWSFQHFLDLDEDRAREGVRVYQTYYRARGIRENAPYPGIRDLLADLRDAGRTLAVATSKPEDMAVQVLQNFDLLPYFACVAGATAEESVDRKAESIRRCLARCGGAAVMVGDRAYDVRGAHENHIPCVGVLYGYGSRAEFEEAGADAVAGDVDHLRQLLLGDAQNNTKE